MKKALLPHCSIIAWCLMPNHFHWLVVVNKDYEPEYYSNERTKKLNPLNNSIGSLLSSYTQQINKKQDRSGSLFRKRTKAKSLNEHMVKHDDYLLNCFLYVHQNPIRAGLVNKLRDWEFSSYKDYSGLRHGELCDKDLMYDFVQIPKSFAEFQKLSILTIPEFYIQKISKFG
jgi:REP element-mobilizing transposase RayT